MVCTCSRLAVLDMALLWLMTEEVASRPTYRGSEVLVDLPCFSLTLCEKRYECVVKEEGMQLFILTFNFQ